MDARRRDLHDHVSLQDKPEDELRARYAYLEDWLRGALSLIHAEKAGTSEPLPVNLLRLSAPVRDEMNAISDELTRRRMPDLIRRDFPPDEWEPAAAELARYGEEPYEREVYRVRLAILKLAQGDLPRLGRLVQDAKRDYRDVLAWSTERKPSRPVSPPEE